MSEACKKLSINEAKKVAQLAYLKISDNEAEKVTAKLNSILDYVSRLDAVDVSGVEPMSHVHGVTNVFREDAVEASMPIEELKKIAPDSSGRFIKVPIVIADAEGA